MFNLWLPSMQHRSKRKNVCNKYLYSLYQILYIYTQRLFNNNQLDVYSCKVLLKSVLEAEKEICIRNRKTANFEKYNFIYWNL